MKDLEERTITCRWCYGIYIQGLQEEHKECKRRRHAYNKRKRNYQQTIERNWIKMESKELKTEYQTYENHVRGRLCDDFDEEAWEDFKYSKTDEWRIHD